MSKLIWGLAWAGVVAWSLLSLGAYAMVDLAGSLLGAAGPPPAPDSFRTGDPPPFEWLYPVAVAFQRLGAGAIAFVWFIVSATMLATAWVAVRVGRTFFPPRDRPRLSSPGHRRAFPGHTDR